MKMRFAVLALAACVVLPLASQSAAQESRESREEQESPGTNPAQAKVERSVAFRTAAGKYLSAAAKGAMNASGSSIGGNQTFTLTDLNGGELEDGDQVRIRFGGGAGTDPASKSKPSYWRVEDGKLGRYANKPDEKSVFVVHKKDKTIALQAENGSFVSVSGAALATVETQDDTSALEIVDATAEQKPTTSDEK